MEEINMKRAFTIYYDDWSMEVREVALAPAFKEEESHARADILFDCYRVFTDMSRQSLKDLRRDGERLAEGRQPKNWPFI